MKKLLSILLVAVMLVTCMTVTAFAAKAGDTVEINFTASNPGAAVFGAKINYDSSVLELVSISRGALASEGMFSGTASTGKVAYLGENNITGSGILFVAKFKVLDAAVAGETYPVTATVDTSTTADAEGNLVSFSISGGSIKIDDCDHSWSAWTGTEATCGAAGNLTRTCSKCGATETSTPAATGNHTWGEWTGTEATCGAAGNLTRECSVCHKTETSTPAATGNHNHVKDTAASYDATCAKDGKLVEVCSVCGDTKTTTLPATGNHNHVKDEAASSDATCGKDGKLVEVCSVCGDTKTTTLPATGNHKNGTYTKIDGNDKQHKVSCSVCGKEDELENHSWDNGTEKTPATCAKPGEKIFTCTKCGYEKSEEIKATGKHSWGKWTKVDDDVHEHVCSVCGASEEDEHNWDSGKVTVKPTEEKDGERTFTCADCGATKTAVEKWKDNVPNTGDITPQITMYAVALVVMMGAVALVFKRKTAK